MLVGIVLQGRDIASVTIAVDRAALGKCSLRKLFDRGLFDVLCDLYFGISRIPKLIQGYATKTLSAAYGSCEAPSPQYRGLVVVSIH